MSYKYSGPDGSGGQKYIIVLKLYRGCEPVDNNHADFDPSVYFTIYDNTHSELFNNPVMVNMNSRTTISASSNDPCIINPPQSCYEMALYQATVDLPANMAGYTITYQRCCRTDLLTNANTTYNIGATYTTTIPGAATGIPLQDGPYFSHEQAVLICAGSRFSYDYSATVPAGDSASYSFCEAYAGGSANNDVPVPADPPPYPSLDYVPPYSSASPMGSQVTINPNTGLISGIAPVQGIYVITVCVIEFSHGVPVGSDRKDFHITVTDCNRESVASIPPQFNTCTSFTIPFTNGSTPTKVNLWHFGDGDTSTDYTPVHTYRDTGTYLVSLAVDPGSSCGDSATTTVLVYPVLQDTFSVTGACYTRPVLFQDGSNSTSGVIDYWHWNFGDPSNISADTANVRDTTYKYPQSGNYPVILTIGNSKGCVRSDTQQVNVYSSPPLMASNDTDMCIRDSLIISASSLVTGNFAWGPPYNILGSNTADPTVFPRQDTTYNVSFTDISGCTNIDSVGITVKSVLEVNAGTDTTICLGDMMHLHATSDGEYGYSWYNSSSALVGSGQDILLNPVKTDTYTVIASLGSCSASSTVQVRVVPPPQVMVNPDTSICYGDTIALLASGGSIYSWSPAIGLSNTATANPEAFPRKSTSYLVTVTDTLGCPKPMEDSVMVGVYPPVLAFAGNDTIISRGQNFQLHASGGTQYAWSPAQGLSNPAIADPVVNMDQDISYLLTVQTPAGCIGYDTLKIRYVDGPNIYVPDAFTPNGDGKNDIFRPIPVGILRMNFFRVFNRWGQLVYQGRGYMQGWDGMYGGKKADMGTYVWEAEGVDYTGKTIFKKGTVILIR